MKVITSDMILPLLGSSLPLAERQDALGVIRRVIKPVIQRYLDTTHVGVYEEADYLLGGLSLFFAGLRFAVLSDLLDDMDDISVKRTREALVAARMTRKATQIDLENQVKARFLTSQQHFAQVTTTAEQYLTETFINGVIFGATIRQAKVEFKEESDEEAVQEMKAVFG